MYYYKVGFCSVAGVISQDEVILEADGPLSSVTGASLQEDRHVGAKMQSESLQEDRRMGAKMQSECR